MENFSFVQITDHHLLEADDQLRDGFCPGYSFRMVMQHIAKTVGDKVNFIVSTGDLCDPPTAKAYQAAMKSLGVKSSVSFPGPLKINAEDLHDLPMYFLPGNHDDRAVMTQNLFSTSKSSELYNFTFEYKDTQFIFLDWGPETQAVFLPETREFLAKALKSALPSVLICHQQVKKIGVAWLDSFVANDIDQFWEMVLPHKAKMLGILSGHMHITYEDIYQGIPILGVRSTSFQFARTPEPITILAKPHYRFVNIQNDILTSRIYEVPI